VIQQNLYTIDKKSVITVSESSAEWKNYDVTLEQMKEY
jgi:hypothetical protein